MLREQLPTDILCVASIRAHVHRLIHILVPAAYPLPKKDHVMDPPRISKKPYDGTAMEMPVHAGLAAVGRLPRARSTRREPKRNPTKDPKWMPGKCPQGIRNPGGMEPVFDANAYPIVERFWGLPTRHIHPMMSFTKSKRTGPLRVPQCMVYHGMAWHGEA